MIEAVMFDVDGTLVDSVNLHAKAWQVAFEKFDKACPWKRFVGRSARAPISYCPYSSRRMNCAVSAVSWMIIEASCFVSNTCRK
ncbi:MAG TPA: HAD hydrolase-like protein [Terriglobales bacterium]|jgi:FMN phosphatase YigB (HAD superfamily)|nr:HAD hydrolase-like protein [Terriglobales bacterium]